MMIVTSIAKSVTEFFSVHAREKWFQWPLFWCYFLFHKETFSCALVHLKMTIHLFQNEIKIKKWKAATFSRERENNDEPSSGLLRISINRPLHTARFGILHRLLFLLHSIHSHGGCIMLYLSVDDGVLDGGNGGGGCSCSCWTASCVGVYLVHTTLDTARISPSSKANKWANKLFPVL
jgi:hypothetical protein